MEEGIKLLERVMYLIMFCLGITYILQGFQSVDRLRVQVANWERTPAIIENERTPEEILYSKGEILCWLLTPCEYPVDMNGIYINAGYHSKDQILSYSIPEGKYQKIYKYEASGEIQKIIVKKLGKRPVLAMNENTERRNFDSITEFKVAVRAIGSISAITVCINCNSA